MKLSKQLENEIREMYIAFWDSYMQGDKTTFFTYLNKIVRMTGTTEGEDYNNKVAVRKFIDDTRDQVVGKVDFRNRRISISPLDTYYLVYEQMHLYVLVGSNWTFYAKVRISAIVRKDKTEWKFIQLHASIPDAMTEEGETIAMQKISKENLELREAVKRRTVELENKNWELEIETALEKVRAIALGMKDPADMLDVCKTISLQLQTLGVKEIRNVQTAIFYESKGTYINYEYYAKHRKTIITESSYTNHKVHKDLAKKMLQGKGESYSTHIKGKKVKEWIAYQKTTNVFIDRFLEKASSLNYYWHSLGPVALGISTYSPLNKDELNLFNRFLNVFELAYTRYLDIEQALVQTKEARIELALERVRARAMSMQRSDELAELVATVFKELTELDFSLTSCIIWIHDHEHASNTLWIASAEMSKPAQPFPVHPFHVDFFKSIIHAWKAKDPKWVYSLTGNEKKIFEKAFFKELPNLPDALRKALRVPKQVVFSASFNKFGALEIVETEALTNEKFDILHRFGKVFDSSYTRFNDLKKAEAQAREAQIEASLERIRSRAMAMHNSDELGEAAILLYRELQSLGITQFINCGYVLVDEINNAQYAWMTHADGTIRESHQMPLTGDSVMDIRYESWKRKDPVFHQVVGGEQLKNHLVFVSGKTYTAGGTDNVIPQLPDPTVFYCGNFSEGYLHILSNKEISKESEIILSRYTSVFEITYRRFRDLQKAEAQTRDAQIEVALERVRARTMAMQKSDELAEAATLVFQQFSSLGLLPEASRVFFSLIDEATLTSEVWTTKEDGMLRPGSHRISLKANKHLIDVFDSWKAGKSIYNRELTGNELTDYLKYIASIPNLNEDKTIQQVVMAPPDRLVFTEAFFEQGTIGVIGFIPLTQESQHTLTRFSKVFEQTYTRFLDLQKAEAQAREAQIELSLERVRTRTMIMQKSEELVETSVVLFQELRTLGVKAIRTGVAIIDNEKELMELWSSQLIEQKQNKVLGMVPMHAHPFFEGLLNAWRQNDTDFIYVFEGEKVKEFYQAMSSIITYPAQDHYNPCEVFSPFFFPEGSLTVVSHNILTDEERNIMQRFARVFGLLYRRFHDLQKAEAQAREAQIEAALERVRARSMAMHKTDELLEAAELVSNELSGLGIISMNVSYAFVDENEQYASYYSLNPVDGKIPPFPFVFPHTETDVMRSILASWNKQEPFHVIELDEEATLIHQTYIGEHIQNLITKNKIDIPFSVDAFLEISPKKAVLYTFNFKKGYLFNIGGQRLTTEQEELLLRFTKVFEQTYTRFLDLQKAEAQAREAQIENALEKVRSRTMAMQRSEELPEAANNLFLQVQSLGIPAWSAGYCVWDEDKQGITLWMSSEGVMQPSAHAPCTEDPSFIHMREAYERGDAFHVEEQGGEALVTHYKYMRTLPVVGEILDSIIAAGHPLPTFQIFHCVYFSQGFLLFITYESVPEAHNIFKRFTNVFEQTYTRFLDLQKAEAQTREGKIETALERVRSRTMGMQKSEELKEVIQVVYAQFVHLNILIEHTGFIIDYKARDDMHIWLADRHEVPSEVTIPYFDCAHWNSFIEAKEKGLDFFANQLSFEEKNRFYQDLFKLIPGVPEETKEYYFSCPGLAISTVLLENVGLYIENFSGISYSDEENATLMRFGKVFQQTYTRFLDLQKAEAQSREGQIELGLERVRARAMAMQKSEELSELVDTVFKELTKLDFALTWCIINIIDENSMSNTVWAANPDIDKAPESYYMKFEDYPFHHAMMKGWKERKTKDVYVLEGLEKKVYDEYLFNETEFRRVPAAAQAASRAMEKYVVTFSFSNFGGLQTVGDVPLSDANLDILSRFGKVFDLTYTRFNDLKLAEAQAREGKIEAALERTRTQSMLMQHSNELDITSRVFHEQLLLLGIDSELSYVWLPDVEKEKHLFWATWNEEQNGFTILQSKSATYDLDRTEPYTAECFIAWESGEPVHVYHVAQAQVKHYFDIWSGIMGDAKKLTPAFFPEGLDYVESFMKYGCFGIIMRRSLTDVEKKILHRFTIEFERTYTRFLDLQKAEAQTRESNIELALERVRARTMAMQRSEELGEVATLLFKELNQVVENLWTCGFVLCEKDRTEDEWWLSTGDGFIPAFFLPNLGDVTHANIYNAWKNGETYHTEQLEGAALQDHYDWLMSIPVSRKIFEDMFAAGYSLPAWQKLHCAYFSYGYLVMITKVACPEEEIFKRFARVFDQTYTRFLDLQKAEAQAREAKIEAALEKVRSKTMAMHNSQDVADTVATMFDELVKLGIETYRCGIGIMHDTNPMEVWTAKPGVHGKADLVIGLLDMTIHPLFQGALIGWRKKEESFSYDLKGDDLINYYNILNNQPDYPIKYDLSSLPPQLFHYDYYFQEGTLFVFSLEPLPAEASKILKRFAAVFGQTYRRYLDLQKAEAQAREATIEAALEKVRGKAMAMHNSNDLTVTASMVFTELRKLNIYSIRSGVGLLTKESRKVTLYAATSTEEGDNLSLVGWSLLQDHAVLSEIYDSWIRHEDYFPVLKGELLKTYYEKIKSSFKVPDSQSGYEQYGYFLAFSEGCFYGWSEKPYTETEIKILNRFKMIIDLTFRRYIELQKSESNARDAVRRASLDRVRAETASMRTTADLERITPLIWSELTTLGVPFIRCGVFIMDQQQQQIHTFLSTPDGKAIAAFHLPYTSPGTTVQVLEHWRKKKMYKEHWDEAAFLEWTKNLVTQGAIAPSEKYVTDHHPTNLDLHFLPFLQGMLYVGSETPLSDEELHLVQNLADAFSTAYARYEDFNRLEAAKEQIENTLVNLKQTQAQLVQSEKMASLGELTAGIAHEIQNPLNFVNNFSEVSTELLDEMLEEVAKGNYEEVKSIVDDIKQNLEKINHHGKRADGIVKGMLQHSRSSSGEKVLTDLNALVDEYLRLAFHGLRAKDKSFNAGFKTDFDSSIGKVEIIPQDIGRVLVNLISNAFYAVNEKRNSGTHGYEPMVTVSTKKVDNRIEVRVTDNGNGIPKDALDKVFQPFFTTKPTGQGTGLGLSLSYDIIKAHGGQLNVVTEEGKGSEFIISLPAF